jgi:hypothetical protein
MPCSKNREKKLLTTGLAEHSYHHIKQGIANSKNKEEYFGRVFHWV